MMRRLWPVALLMILGAGLTGRASSSPAGSPLPGEPYLPDLRTVKPSGFHLAESSSGDRLLLLSNTIWNAGDGPLEMRPEHDEVAGVTHAFQLLYTEDATGALELLPDEHEAGEFAFHPSHNHWHFQDLARYSLVEMTADGGLGATVGISDKISFCMFDQRQIDPDLENASDDPAYSGFACDQNTNVGYSVSWGDEYAYNFADQDIVINDVPPGDYWVKSVADPENLLLETNDNNNGAKTAVRLTEDSVRAITDTTGTICKPCGRTDLYRENRYKFKGSTLPSPGPRPTFPTPEVQLSFKRQGASSWSPFGLPGTDSAFTLMNEEDGPIGFDGAWDRWFLAHEKGTWVVRARYDGGSSFTASATKEVVVVD
jgi:hypothetical protein